MQGAAPILVRRRRQDRGQPDHQKRANRGEEKMSALSREQARRILADPSFRELAPARSKSRSTTPQATGSISTCGANCLMRSRGVARADASYGCNRIKQKCHLTVIRRI